MHNTPLKNFWIILKTKHRKNQGEEVYGYMWKAALKIILIYLLIMIPAVLIGKYLIDFNTNFKLISDRLPTIIVLAVFFLSESFLGMIPPDLFVIWTAKFNSPFFFLTILGVLSYIGGVISYFIGNWLSNRERIKVYSERVLDRYISMVKKWGGAFIIISALFPFSPYSMVVIAVSLFKYPFKKYLLFGLFRIARFIIQGVLYLNMFKMGSFLERL
jgi:membrane protein YqaA with SNARE-associated domain